MPERGEAGQLDPEDSATESIGASARPEGGEPARSRPEPPPTHGEEDGSGEDMTEGDRDVAGTAPMHPQGRGTQNALAADGTDQGRSRERPASTNERSGKRRFSTNARSRKPPFSTNERPDTPPSAKDPSTRTRPLRVVHCPVNTAGVPWTNVQALRSRGVDARLVVFNRYALHPEADWSLDRDGGAIRRQLSQWTAFLQLLPTTDVFHFYFGLTLVPRALQFPALAALGKKSVLHYLGSDIRGKTPAELAYGNKADAQVVGSYDAIRWVPDADVIPPGVDVRAIAPAPPSERSRPVVVHAPSSRRRKGTDEVIAACERLDVDLVLVEGLHHSEAFERYRDADIVIDQLNAGWYGLFAIECMALGKPVLAYLHEDAVRRTESAFGARVPVVPVTRESLSEKVRALAESSSERRRIGAESRAYVERVHDVEAVADRLLALYARL